MAQATQELIRLKEKLQKHIAVLKAEMDAVDKAIQLLERENQSGTTGPQDRRFRKLGLSDACRQVVGSEWISPSTVRNQLMEGGYKNANRSKLLGSVFATMKRLAGKMNEFEAKKIGGKFQYRKRQPAALSSAEAA